MKKHLLLFLILLFSIFGSAQKVDIIGNGYVTGNLGIGVTSPISKLQVGDLGGNPDSVYITVGSAGGNTSVSGIKLRHFSEAYGFSIESDDRISSQGLNFRLHANSVPGSSAMFIDVAGNVGIGTTAPNQKLDVNGSMQVDGIISGVSDPIAAQDAATKTYVDKILIAFGISLGSVGIEGLLNAGICPLEILNAGVPKDSLYGKMYQGGIIFYLDDQDEVPDIKGMVAAVNDQNSAPFGCLGTTIGGTSTDLGSGAANTPLIVSGCTTQGIAAQICDDLIEEDFEDWHLPSLEELEQIYLNLHLNGLGGFQSGQFDFYATSSEPIGNSTTDSYVINFSDGFQGLGNKSNAFNVRAVRSF